jgi:hypothetical protein
MFTAEFEIINKNVYSDSQSVGSNVLRRIGGMEKQAWV